MNIASDICNIEVLEGYIGVYISDIEAVVGLYKEE